VITHNGPMPFTRTLPPNWQRTDALIALALAVVGALMAYASVVAGVAIIRGPDSRLLMLSAVLLAIPIAWYRRFPTVVAFTIPTIYVVTSYTLGVDMYVSQVALYLSFYAVSAWENDRRRALIVRIIIVVAMALWLLFETIRGFSAPETGELGVSAYFAVLFIQWMINLAFFGAAWIFGQRSWDSARERQELDSAYKQIRAQQQIIAEHAIEAERVRIARELHDTVAHHVTVMGVQAAAARRTLTSDSDAATEQLRAVESSSRQAVQELQTMVHTLRDSGADPTALPGISQLEDLVSQARAAGQKIDFEIVDGTESPPLALSPAAELTVYRVVQESLSNARKHAGPSAQVGITLRYLPAAIEVDVSDDGWGVNSPGAGMNGTGTGIVGMEERVRALGGTFKAGPKSRGGWLVRIQLPIAAASTAWGSNGESDD